ncbi:hypothetical protein SEA_CHASER_3 [Mycobacterium phage Chaser]|nr:hypothetical protein SEA_CHASER_3 [Mycobacterium phage Chaser]
MPGMMQSIRSGRGVVCQCCSEWTATRAREKRLWMREVEEGIADYDRECVEVALHIEPEGFWTEREDFGDV